MNQANLTRFGPENLECGQSPGTTLSRQFRASEGAGELVLHSQGAQQLTARLNGLMVLDSSEVDDGAELILPVELVRENSIELTAVGAGAGSVIARITQQVQADLGVLRQGYFGLNTTDIERQRALYKTLGFIGEIYPAGPERSTSFARSLGFPDDYLIYVSLHSLEDPPTPPFVDTVQFRGEYYREEPPYAALNHVGMAYATYSTTNLDGAYAHMLAEGVDFVSAPATAPDGERFVFFRDQDGTFLKLMEATEEEGARSARYLGRLANTNMNVTDLERSREFYRLVGFNTAVERPGAGAGDFAAAHGFAEPIEFDGLDVSLDEAAGGATLQLRQWKTPFDDAPPYSPPVNHLGIDRINFYVKDLTATIQTMKDLGFEPLGPIGGSREIGIVFFFDPDGIKVQFAGPQPD